MDSTAADDFYRRAGIIRHADAAEFWNTLDSGCGRDAVDELRGLVERRARGEVEPHDIELLVTDLPRVRLTTDAFAPHTIAWLNSLAVVSDVRAALDIGCGGGVATCFLALRNPDARVVGVDLNEAAIDAARALAVDLGIDNVDFRVADIDALDLGETFDFVVSSAVWAESEPWVHAQRWWSSVNRLSSMFDEPVTSSALAATAARHLAADGVYLSLERCRDIAGLGAWVAALQAVGLNFDATISDMLTIEGVLSGTERIPLVAAHRSTLAAGVTDIVQWRLQVGDVRLDESLMAEMVMAGGDEWSLVHGTIFEASEDEDEFSAALLLLERGAEAKLYFATTRGVREILASNAEGGPDQFAQLYEQMREHLGGRPSVVDERAADAADLHLIVPRLPAA